MKKIFLTFVTVVLLCSCGDSPLRVLEAIPFDGITGNVAKATEKTFDTYKRQGEILPEEVPKLTYTAFYNKDGCVEKYIHKYRSHEENINEFEYRNKQLIQQTYTYGKDRTVTKVSDISDTKATMVSYIEGATQDTIAVELDARNKVITRISKNYKFVLYYDKSKVIKEEQFHQGKLTFRLTHTYDKNGLKIKTVREDGYGNMSNEEYEYTKFDDKGNWTECIVRNTEPENIKDFEIILRDIEYR